MLLPRCPKCKKAKLKVLYLRERATNQLGEPVRWWISQPEAKCPECHMIYRIRAMKIAEVEAVR